VATASPATAPASTSPAALTLLIEPGAGMGPIYALLNSALHRVDLVMYELEDTHAEQLLAAAAARGVAVRVLLNSAYTASANDAAFSYLERHGVHVQWASPLYALTHQKTLVVDASVAVIMTMNWTSRYYADTRDVGVIDRIPSDVAAIEAAFEADDAAARIAPSSGADLVWSPTSSTPDLLALINSARRDLFVENEEMGSSGIIGALITAARRGVNVKVCMTDSSRWSTAFEELVSAGVHIRVYSPAAALYIHAKLLVRDPGLGDQEAFAGSQNFSTESLRYNRELGILVTSGELVRQLGTLIQDDFNGASPWSG
jgi:cardiolipin synthase A/B